MLFWFNVSIWSQKRQPYWLWFTTLQVSSICVCCLLHLYEVANIWFCSIFSRIGALHWIFYSENGNNCSNCELMLVPELIVRIIVLFVAFLRCLLINLQMQTYTHIHTSHTHQCTQLWNKLKSCDIILSLFHNQNIFRAPIHFGHINWMENYFTNFFQLF